MIVQVQWGVLFTGHTQNTHSNENTSSFLYLATVSLVKLGLPSAKYPLRLLFDVFKIQSSWDKKKKKNLVSNKVYISGLTFVENAAMS